MAKRGVIILLFSVTIWAAACGAVQSAESSSDTRSIRRTPVVDVYEKCSDSVVYITGPIVRGAKAALEEFFETDGRPPKEGSMGTGFVIHKSGFVVTNAHVVEKTLDHFVIPANGNKGYRAELLAVVHEQDIALLQLLGQRPLKPVRLAQSGDLMIGETVVVIGSPLGLRNTCTVGVLSAIGRTTQIADLAGVTLRDTIQSDAAISQGSSGGPWFNLAGDVIGMTTSMKKDAQNVALAVSTATLRKTLPPMLNVERRFRISSGLHLWDDGRCEVATVDPESPADKIGIRRGDFLVGLAGEPLATSLDFQLGLIDRKPGETVAVEVLRDGKRRTLALTLAQRPMPDVKSIVKQKLGIEAEAMGTANAKAMGLRVLRGLFVTSVDPAVYAQLKDRPVPQAGDVLVRIGSIRPRDLDQAAEQVENLKPGDAIDLVFVRRRENVATRTDVHLVMPR